MPSNSKKRRGAILSAAVVAVWLIALVAVVLLAAREAPEEPALWLLALLYAVPGGAVITGVLLALRQRLKELEGGEEDDAARY